MGKSSVDWSKILGLGSAGGLAAGPIGIAAGVGTGVLGSILGSNAQKKANQTNLQIARETNAQNEAINRANINAAWQNLQYQTRQNMLEAQRGRDFEHSEAVLARDFNAQQAAIARQYESPVVQARMRMAAGLSPFADPGGSTVAANGSPLPSAPTGSAGTQSLPSSIPMQATRVDPVPNQLALVGQIMKDISIASATSMTSERIAAKQSQDTRRGQDINKDIADDLLYQNAFDAAAMRDLQDRLSKRSADLVEKQLSLAENGTWYEQMMAKNADERVLIDWFNAHTNRKVGEAQVNLFAANATDIMWTLNNIKPEEKSQVVAQTQKLLQEAEKLKRENKFTDKTWNAMINKYIWSENIDRTTSQLLDRSLRNLSNLDDKEWIMILNSILGFFGGSGLTPGYSVK